MRRREERSGRGASYAVNVKLQPSCVESQVSPAAAAAADSNCAFVNASMPSVEHGSFHHDRYIGLYALRTVRTGNPSS